MKINLTKRNIEAIEQAQRCLMIGSMHMDMNCAIGELEKVLNKIKGAK